MIRARRVVEGEVAAMAAVLAKRKHIDAMSKAIALMTADADGGVLRVDNDHAFHTALVESCGNVVLIETVQRFWASRRRPLYERMGEHFETVKSWRWAIDEHTAILDAIRNHDAEAARLAMHEHMDKAHTRFSVSWRQTKETKTQRL